MITADPNRIANEAMNMFIDMLEPMRDRVGIVAYAGHVTYSRNLTPLCENEIEALQNSVTNLEYASWTDHPLGLLEAIRIMYEGTTTSYRQPIIIFLTDGNLNVNPWGTRTMEQAEYDQAYVIDLAINHGFPIFSIGLNFDGQLDRRYIDIVAQKTGGLSFETTNAEDLPGIIDSIFSLMLYITQPPELESEPVPEFLPVPITIEETPYIPQEYTTIEEIPRSKIWVIAVIIIGIGLIFFMLLRKPKRVFTGRLIIEIVDENNRLRGTPLYCNLIEYGHRTTLEKLTGGDPTLKNVALFPSPKSPSYLPQLIIKCNKPHIKFVKNFADCDASKGLEISTGTDVTVLLEDKQIRLRYVV